MHIGLGLIMKSYTRGGGGGGRRGRGLHDVYNFSHGLLTNALWGGGGACCSLCITINSFYRQLSNYEITDYDNLRNSPVTTTYELRVKTYPAKVGFDVSASAVLGSAWCSSHILPSGPATTA